MATDNHSIRVVMLSIYDTDKYINESKDAGASAYVVKSSEIDTLANAIRRAFAEEPDKDRVKPTNMSKKATDIDTRPEGGENRR